MKHDRALELLADYSVGRLRGRKKRALEQHIAHCPTCTRELRALQRTEKLLNSAGMIRPASPHHLWQRIQFAANQSPVEQTAGRGKGRLKGIIIATALALLVSAYIVTWRLRIRAMDQHYTVTYAQYHHLISWSNPLTDCISTGAMFGATEERE